MLQPVAPPAVSNASCNLVRGVRSLTATHARAWSAIVAANETTSVFEDDIAHGRDPGIVRMQFETFLHEHRTCDLALFGNCGRRILCTHAYQVSPRAAAALLAIYHNSTGGCMEPDWPQKLLCSSPAHEEGYSRNAHGEELYSDTPWGGSAACRQAAPRRGPLWERHHRAESIAPALSTLCVVRFHQTFRLATVQMPECL